MSDLEIQQMVLSKVELEGFGWLLVIVRDGCSFGLDGDDVAAG